MLHSAAFLALPEFVQWLMDAGHDPNAISDEWGQPYIPLAIVCFSKLQPYCKAANHKSKFSSRQKTTMKILASRTNQDWQHNRQTVLHIALHQAPKITEAMVYALDIKHDKQRDDRYIYVDKDDVEYSPHMYVKHRMTISEKEKKALLKSLKKGNMKPRHFKRVMPGEGEQPTNAHGLPPIFKEAWENHYKSLKQETKETEAGHVR
jgi:anion-transporting  ArsA/GET3 family ATPase